MRTLGTTRRRTVAVIAAVASTAVVGAIPAVAGPAACTQRMPGGDWARYGQDLMGQNRQVAERTLSPDNVARLEKVWGLPDTGYYTSAPIVSGGCVFINTGGRYVAHDLDDGKVVWESDGADTRGTFAAAVVDGRVHAHTGGGRPRATAFDVRTGEELWLSDEIRFGQDTNQLASAVVWNGMQITFTTGPDFQPSARQGYGITDARTGRVLYKTTTLSQKDLDAGYSGGGVWGTPNVDPRTGYLYAATSNPESKTKEHAYDNAVLKIDLNRKRKTFGRVVASYKGTPDSVTGYDNPVCQTVGGTAWVDTGGYGSSPTCGQLDVDFGNGPTLWRDKSGRTLGAITQKSGVMHVFDAMTMKGVWSKELFVSTSFISGNIGRSATDGETLYTPGNPGSLYAFDGDTGVVKWQTRLPMLPPTGGNVALANGVVYWVVDGYTLYAFDAETGKALYTSPRVNNAGPNGALGSGVAVAGGYVVANHSGAITVYRLSGGG